ncbi:hypothetical protein RG47T_5192 [Mucilaginibacter polytrichastri]|uniref:Uncharacterized protein n=1 Tax=Mucilaginibacter polytrichastri TaxID=1302689 RepID=A0A1Q6A6R3_9SPHI|nr:hypothetical protein RG47T_5192 [Mucilaginibacter polytrichastri]
MVVLTAAFATTLPVISIFWIFSELFFCCFFLSSVSLCLYFLKEKGKKESKKESPFQGKRKRNKSRRVGCERSERAIMP